MYIRADELASTAGPPRNGAPPRIEGIDEWLYGFRPKPESDNLNVREAAARLLGHLSDQTAVEPLSRLLRDDEEQVREAARTALENLGGGTAESGLGER